MEHPARSENNFDFLRFLAAMMVVVSHSFWLYERSNPLAVAGGQFGIGPIAVYMFFVISGFLITASWQNSQQVFAFFAKRLLRILPALTVVTLLTVLVVGPLATDLPLGRYYSDSQTWGYLSNLFFWVQYRLPGVFAANPFPHTVNGSIWTLPFVILMDLSLVGLALSGLLRRSTVLVGALALMLLNIGLLTLLDVDSRGLVNLIRLGAYFYAGVALYLLFDRVPRSGVLALALAVVLAVGIGAGAGGVAAMLTLPYLVVYLAFARIPRLARFGRHGDFSFGIYLFGFPLQQLLIHWLGTEQLSLYGFIALSMTASLAMGVLSFHLVERPALRLRRYLPSRPFAGAMQAAVTRLTR
jgi:peptidoglycan/LPS O-acetylase OafA/YrhL